MNSEEEIKENESNKKENIAHRLSLSFFVVVYLGLLSFFLFFLTSSSLYIYSFFSTD